MHYSQHSIFDLVVAALLPLLFARLCLASSASDDGGASDSAEQAQHAFVIDLIAGGRSAILHSVVSDKRTQDKQGIIVDYISDSKEKEYSQVSVEVVWLRDWFDNGTSAMMANPTTDWELETILIRDIEYARGNVVDSRDGTFNTVVRQYYEHKDLFVLYSISPLSSEYQRAWAFKWMNDLKKKQAKLEKKLQVWMEKTQAQAQARSGRPRRAEHEESDPDADEADADADELDQKEEEILDLDILESEFRDVLQNKEEAERLVVGIDHRLKPSESESESESDDD